MVVYGSVQSGEVMWGVVWHGPVRYVLVRKYDNR